VTAIQQAHAGTQVVALDIFNDLSSADNMWTQVSGAIQAIQALPAPFNGGYICIGFSQGFVLFDR